MTAVGIDYGRSRTGLAILIRGTILPLEPVTASTWNGIASRLDELSAEHGELMVVLGLPLTSSGKQTELSIEVESLGSFLAGKGFEVTMQRETGSSLEIRSLGLAEARDGRSDSMAAMVILKRYLGQA